MLDLHRDAVPGGTADTVRLDGEDCARLMLVVGTDAGGLEHPNWQENLSFALKLQALLNRSSPGMCRDISLRSARFNQHFTPCSVLVEMGTADNTLAQTLPTARRLAGAPVIHLDLPEYVAIFPSAVMAYFMVTKGFPVLINLKNTGFSLSHSSRMKSVTTSIPASRRIDTPLPETSGLGSLEPITTLLIPESMIARVHGGCFP